MNQLQYSIFHKLIFKILRELLCRKFKHNAYSKYVAY